MALIGLHLKESELEFPTISKSMYASSSEELQGKLVEILTSIQTATGKASDFAMEQLPDIVRSYVTYGQVVSLVNLLTCILVLAGSAWLIFKAYKEGQRSCGEQNELLLCGGGVLGIVGSSLSLIFLHSAVNSAILVWFAPKVWLLRELAHLIR